MNTVRPVFLLLALISLIVTGCSHGGRPGGVSVSIVDFRPTDASLLESRGILTLRFTNENIAPLGFSGSRHKLYLNGSYVGTAVNSKPFGVPPLDSVTQEVPIQFENMALIRQLIAMRDSQTAAYRLESVLFQTIYEEKFEIKSHSEGSLDLRKLAGTAK